MNLCDVSRMRYSFYCIAFILWSSSLVVCLVRLLIKMPASSLFWLLGGLALSLDQSFLPIPYSEQERLACKCLPSMMTILQMTVSNIPFRESGNLVANHLAKYCSSRYCIMSCTRPCRLNTGFRDDSLQHRLCTR